MHVVLKALLLINLLSLVGMLQKIENSNVLTFKKLLIECDRIRGLVIMKHKLVKKC